LGYKKIPQKGEMEDDFGERLGESVIYFFLYSTLFVE
jgi:hypothetical protein